MLTYDTSHLEKICCELVAAVEKQLSWKWDNRFKTVLAEFSVNDKESVRNWIKPQMGEVWEPGTVGNAQESVKQIMDSFGGLNPGQLLFTSDPKRQDVVFCAWWPWGNGRTISIRVGAWISALSREEKEQLIRLFRGWFDL